MTETNPDIALCLMIGLVAVAFLFLAVGALHFFIRDFTRELKYINREIERADDGGERRYWTRRKRRLWLSIIPFIKY